jgi:chromosomal replication initiation ATPase DnaA
MVGAAFALSPNAIRDPHRGRATAAFARQVAIHLAHTRLGLSFTEAGAYFGRDRTTAAHACRTVEDKREDPSIDAIVDFLERAIEICPDLRSGAAR